MKKRKHLYTFEQYKEIVAEVETTKAKLSVNVDKACEACAVPRKFYNYARQMLRRGKPLAELGI